MTKKHFEAIANCLRQCAGDYKKEEPGKEKIVHIVSEAIADTLKRFNPKFNRDKFLIACGVKKCEYPGCEY